MPRSRFRSLAGGVARCCHRPPNGSIANLRAEAPVFRSSGATRRREAGVRLRASAPDGSRAATRFSQVRPPPAPSTLSPCRFLSKLTPESTSPWRAAPTADLGLIFIDVKRGRLTACFIDQPVMKRIGPILHGSRRVLIASALHNVYRTLRTAVVRGGYCSSDAIDNHAPFVAPLLCL